jgi:hypothetical protein
MPEPRRAALKWQTDSLYPNTRAFYAPPWAFVKTLKKSRISALHALRRVAPPTCVD